MEKNKITEKAGKEKEIPGKPAKKSVVRKSRTTKKKKHPGGRPPKFKEIDIFQKKIDAYFRKCDTRKTTFIDKNGTKHIVTDPKPYTVTGLAIALDTSREVILHYEKEKLSSIPKNQRQQFVDAIRRAKMKIHNCAEESLWTPRIAQGMIFNLTNNWGWINKSDVMSGGKPIQSATIIKLPYNARRDDKNN